MERMGEPDGSASRGPSASSANRDSDSATAPTILVVDDDADTRQSLAEVLEENGYRVVALEDGRKAYDYLAREPSPHSLVLDLWMPEMDGWSLASAVLTGRLPRVPMVVVTAAPSHFGYPVPPRYVLRKPINPDRLLTLIGELARQPAG
jgi:CheY-like chemotaxis protein